MQLKFQDSQIAIYDSVLPQQDFEDLWQQIQIEDYKTPTRNENWIKVWRLNDGFSVSSREFLKSRSPFKNAFDKVLDVVLKVSSRHSSLVGLENKDWVDITLRSYLYPRGTKLSWHDDTGGYAGAFSYYVHPKWGSTWGGELLVADTASFEHIRASATHGPYIERAWEDEYLLGEGRGRFISPKPNRLVLTAGGVYHAINRVDPDAGDHLRCSISGFFITPA